MKVSPAISSGFRIKMPVLLWVLLAVGCSEQHTVGVQLQARGRPDGDPLHLEIRAQVTGTQDGLRYKWLSVAGECEPQESVEPATVFKFAEGAKRDRVSVEVWRGNARVAQSELDVRLDDRDAIAAIETPPNVQIEITQIPPYEPVGGPDTRSEIGGKVSGNLSPEFKVVIYARADAWYLQPTAYAQHAIRADNTWSSWTHTGSSYAAFVVRPGFDPFLRLDVLPQVGRYVLARVIVEGTKKQ